MFFRRVSQPVPARSLAVASTAPAGLSPKWPLRNARDSDSNQMKSRSLRFLTVLLGAGLLAVAWPAFADTVTLKDGSIIHGKNLQIANGAVTIATDFAGDLTIKQSMVASLETEVPIFVKTKTSPAVLGKVDPKSSGIIIASPSGNRAMAIEDIKSSWLANDKDPDLAHWSLELSTDITGKSGNSSGFAGNAGVVAMRKTPTDTLKLYGSADHTMANSQTSADNYKAGVEDNIFFSPAFSWFGSTEVMQDNVQDIHLRTTTTSGIGWNAIRSPREDLQFRTGLSYRYDVYSTDPETQNYSSAGANFALVHRLNVSPWFVMHNSLSYMPSFKDTNNCIIDHDSNLAMPLAGMKMWSLRIGMTNEYTSKPVDGDKHLDTTYYLRFVFNVR
jgi:putative salt-induced outer membrane protein YdiY